MLVWLLDLTIAGRTIYLSSEPVEFGGKLYEGTLDQISVTESLDGIGQIPSERTAAVNCLVPDPILSQAIEWGYDFTAARANLKIWNTSEAEHLALPVMVQARVDAPQVGDIYESVSLTLSSEPLDDYGQVLNLDEVVDFDTMYDSDITRDSNPMREEPSGVLQSWKDDSVGIGRYYPLVFGTAGSLILSPAVPFAYNVSPREPSGFVVSARAVADDGGANKVKLYRVVEGELELVENLGASDLTVFRKVDNRGNQVCCVYVDEIGLARIAGDEFWIAWQDVVGSKSASDAGGVDTLAKLIVELAQLSQQPWDIPSLRAAVSSLPGKVAWWIDEPIKPSEALADVLDLVPISFYMGPGGITAVRIDLDPPKEYTVPLVDGINCTRIGPVSMTRRPEDQASELVVEYAPNRAGEGEGMSKIRIKSKGDPGAGFYVTPWSLTASTPEAVQEFRIPWTQDDATAIYIADWLSRKATYTAKTLEVQVRSRLAMKLPPGSPIRFTDPTIYMDEVVGIVSSRTITDDQLWKVELSFFPSTSARATQLPSGGSDDAPPVPVN